MLGRHELVQRLTGRDSYLLRDNDLPLIGGDPVLYLPGVISLIQKGLVIDVYCYMTSLNRMLESHLPPGHTSAQLLSAIELKRPGRAAWARD